MVTLLDVMNVNDNQRIVIEAKETRDQCDPWAVTIFEGFLKEIPEELQQEEVLAAGWGMVANCYVISIYSPVLCR